MLALYPEGSPIVVTYYHKIVSEIDVRSGVTDLSPFSSPVHRDYTKIYNFEMRLLNSLDANFEEIDNGFAITGEAVIYPGFIPHIGDEFLLDMGDNEIGEFKLTNVTPTTYRQGRCHKVTFEIIGYVTQKVLDSLEAGVRETVYFEKNVYVGDGNYTFLKSTDYDQLKKLQELKVYLIKFFTDKFYNTNWESFVRPDGIYDPYIVEYFRHRFSLKEIRVRPSQLYTRLTDYNKSIWSLFTHPNNFAELIDVTPIVHTEYMTATAFATDHNALINRTYLLLGEITKVVPTTGVSEIYQTLPYVFDSTFYQLDYNSLDPIGKAIYNLLVDKKVHAASVLDIAQTFRNLSTDDQFYKIPLIYELVVNAIYAITK